MVTMPKKIPISLVIALSALLLAPVAAFAHVIVTPGQAVIGQELVFHVSVPNERQTAVASVKLLIPNGVADVLPTTENGWTITTTTNGSASNPEVTSITWSGGAIPVGQRQDFSFGAQVPAAATELNWKAYQTYADGTVVHWDQQPAGSDDATGSAGPYSVTQVVNDLSAGSTGRGSDNNATLALVLSIGAIVVSAGGLLIRRR